MSTLLLATCWYLQWCGGIYGVDGKRCKNPRGMLSVTRMLASSEQAWEPMASSSVTSFRTSIMHVNKLILVRQRPRVQVKDGWTTGSTPLLHPFLCHPRQLLQLGGLNGEISDKPPAPGCRSAAGVGLVPRFGGAAGHIPPLRINNISL
jgi:hypothetical protein